MKVVMFEGTSEEFSSCSEALKNSLVVTAQVSESHPASAEPEGQTGRPVTVEEAKKILTRLSLSAVMRRALVKLRSSGDHLMLTSEDLRKETGLNADEFRGMMGAFGRRVKNTVKGNVWFFTKNWNGTQNEWGLTPGARQAMDDLRIR